MYFAVFWLHTMYFAVFWLHTMYFAVFLAPHDVLRYFWAPHDVFRLFWGPRDVLHDFGGRGFGREDARPWSTRLIPGDVDEIASATGISATGESAGAVQLAP